MSAPRAGFISVVEVGLPVTACNIRCNCRLHFNYFNNVLILISCMIFVYFSSFLSYHYSSGQAVIFLRSLVICYDCNLWFKLLKLLPHLLLFY